jgi:hypothetical protein
MKYLAKYLALSLLLLLPNFPRPDATLTPGVVLTKDLRKVCTPGYASSVRHVAYGVRHQVMSAYGVQHEKWSSYELDHLISLQLGGSNDARNLWPEPFPGAHSKDSVENALHQAICTHRLSIDSAQRWIAHNWVTAYYAMKRGNL